MTAPLATIRVERAFGPVVEGEAVISSEGFSPRYDLDRWSGIITKPGHELEGVNIRDKILFFRRRKGASRPAGLSTTSKRKASRP